MKSSVTFDNIMPFMGVVENDHDPLNQGRIQVRCFGVHPSWEDSQDGDGVPTEDLPWAITLQGGYGKFTSIPAISEWVFGFFLDGRDAQHPMVIGMLPGSGNTRYYDVGADGENPYLKPSTEAYRRFGQWPIPPQMGPGGASAMASTPAAIAEALKQSSWSIRGYNPGNKPGDVVTGFTAPGVETGGSKDSSVWNTRFGGSYIEMNGTYGSESIAIVHEKGSVVQLDSSGNVRLSSYGDNFIASHGNLNSASDNNRNEYVRNTYNVEVENGNWTVHVGGNVKHIVSGDYDIFVGGSFSVSTGNAFHVDAGTNVAMRAQSEHFNIISRNQIRVESDHDISFKSGFQFLVEAGTDLSFKSAENMYFGSEGEINMLATSDIYINGENTRIQSGASEGPTISVDAKVPDIEEPPEYEPPKDGGGTIQTGSGYGSLSTGVGIGALDDTV